MDFSFIQISDHHMTESENVLRFGFSTVYALKTVFKHIAENYAGKVDFILTSGDIMEPANETTYRAFVEMFGLRSAGAAVPGPAQITVGGLKDFPFYVLPGNHDNRIDLCRTLFPDGPVLPLINTVFMHKGIRFIALDWGAQPKAVIYPETLAFLEDRLKEGDGPTIILMHHHPVGCGARWLDAFLGDGIERFWALVKGKNVLGVIFGHTHITYDAVVEGIPAYGIRSTAFPFALQDDKLMCLLPPHYRLVTVNNGVLSTQVIEVPL